jgi:cytoskeleton protein RodZ
LIIAACAYAIWYYRASGDRARPERVAEVPAQVVPLPPSDGAVRSRDGEAPPRGAAANPVPESQEKAPPVAAPTPPAGQPADASPAAPPTVAPVIVPPPAAPPAPSQAARLPAVPEPPPATAASNAPRVFGPTTGPVRIVLRATSDSWIQVREPNQSVLSMRVLKPGETYRVPDRAGLTLRTGNAGGLEVTVDGRPVAPVGPPGKSRTVALDPDRLVAGSATSE